MNWSVLAEAAAPLAMTIVTELIMFIAALAILLVGKVKPAAVLTQPLMSAGLVAAIALFGIAWMADTFISGNQETIVEPLDDLTTLVGIPSVAFPGFPEDPVHRMAAAVVELLRRSGATDARLLPIPGGYPAVWAEIPGPAGAPTVTLYAHYDDW